jgi:hypothetical protein
MCLPCDLFGLNTELLDNYRFNALPVRGGLNLIQRVTSVVLQTQLIYVLMFPTVSSFAASRFGISIPNSFSIAMISSRVSSDMQLPI